MEKFKIIKKRNEEKQKKQYQLVFSSNYQQKTGLATNLLGAPETEDKKVS